MEGDQKMSSTPPLQRVQLHWKGAAAHLDELDRPSSRCTVPPPFDTPENLKFFLLKAAIISNPSQLPEIAGSPNGDTQLRSKDNDYLPYLFAYSASIAARLAPAAAPRTSAWSSNVAVDVTTRYNALFHAGF